MRAAGLVVAALLAVAPVAPASADPPASPASAYPPASPGSAYSPASCPDVNAAALPLPRLRDAVLANNEVTVVALGSSSTQGVRSSDIAHSYPAVLQRTLEQGLPNAHVAVLNRGIGGQDVAEELPRLEHDVIGVHPAVVIWQVGANGAMQHLPIELFQRLLTSGVRRLQQARIDVVLMDNQRAQLVLASGESAQIERAMVDIAKATGVALFARGVLMDKWRDAGFPYEQFMSDDGVHHNDRGYRCVAASLAAAMLEGLRDSMKAGPVTSGPLTAVLARH